MVECKTDVAQTAQSVYGKTSPLLVCQFRDPIDLFRVPIALYAHCFLSLGLQAACLSILDDTCTLQYHRLDVLAV